MWECGLKHNLTIFFQLNNNVTPYVGVWIETPTWYTSWAGRPVTPYVGVWIETLVVNQIPLTILSLLMWECGLKPRSPKRNGCRR